MDTPVLTQNLLVAAEDLIHAMGGNPPDWLQKETVALEAAIAEFNTAREKTDNQKLAEALVQFNELPAVLTSLGGNCPVQAEGWIDAQRFYFRARGEHWEFHVAANYADLLINDLFSMNRAYKPGDRFAAGWMAEHEAVGFIIEAIRIYRATRDLADAWEAQGSPGTFDEWVAVMANDEKGTLQEAAKLLKTMKPPQL